MHLTKLFVIGLMLVYTLFFMPNHVVWPVVLLLLIGIMFAVVPLNIKQILFRNIPILSFAIFFSIFFFFSAWLKGEAPDFYLLSVTTLKIIFVFNIMFAGTSWLGREGLLFLIKIVPTDRMKLFFILLYRSVNGLRRNSSGIANQIRSRLDLKGRDKLLVPRYYVRNLIMKDLYAFHHNQAALVSRIGMEGSRLSVCPQSGVAVKDAVVAAVIISAIFINIILMRIFL